MKKKLWIILILAGMLSVLCFGFAAAEPNGQLAGSNVNWWISNTGQLYLSGTGSTPDYDQSPFLSYAPSIKEITVEEGVTGIGSYLFAGCTNVWNIELPESLQSIGHHAFYQTNGHKIILPVGVAYVGNDAFSGCGEMRDIYIHNSGADIGAPCFAGCHEDFVIHGWEGSTAKAHAEDNGFTFDEWPDTDTFGSNLRYSIDFSGTSGYILHIGVSNPTFSETAAMDDYQDEAEPPWYSQRNDFAEVYIENGVTYIGRNAFSSMNSLKKVWMADSVTEIGYGAFSYCYYLNSVKLSANLNIIGDRCFLYCTGLTTIELPAGLKAIGSEGFTDCALTSITVPSGTPTKRWTFFYAIDGEEDAGELYDRCILFNIDLPAGLTDPGYGTFSYNPGLPRGDYPDVILPKDLTEIKDQAFAGTKANFVWTWEDLKTIGSGAFTGSGLRYIFLTYLFDEIAPNAFPEGTVLLLLDCGYGQTYANENGYSYLVLEDPYGGNG